MILTIPIQFDNEPQNIVCSRMRCIFASTVPVLHTTRTAGGSFFFKILIGITSVYESKLG